MSNAIQDADAVFAAGARAPFGNLVVAAVEGARARHVGPRGE